MAWEAASPLIDDRPGEVLEEIKRKFVEQESAGKDKKYGAVGDLDYELSGYIWNAATNLERRSRIFGLSELLTAFCPDASSKEKLRVLDLGCGDGRCLWSLHSAHGLPWANIAGVTAEDSRGVEVLSGEEPFDLRATAGADSNESYIVWNIDDLHKCHALEGRQFDVIVSWVTWIWVSDPMGSLEMIFDRFLAPGGVMMIGGVQVLTTGPDPLEDQRWLFAASDWLVEQDGHQISCFADAATGAYTWWLQRKGISSCQNLGLGRLLRYCRSEPVYESGHKALYDVNADALGDYASRYSGSGGTYPLPPKPGPGAREVPSTRLSENEDTLDDEAKAKHAANLRMRTPRSQLGLENLVQSWCAA